MKVGGSFIIVLAISMHLRLHPRLHWRPNDARLEPLIGWVRRTSPRRHHLNVFGVSASWSPPICPIFLEPLLATLAYSLYGVRTTRCACLIAFVCVYENDTFPSAARWTKVLDAIRENRGHFEGFR